MNKVILKKILLLLLCWRLLLNVIAILSLLIIPLQPIFLGGGLTNYLHVPYIFSWANFDGEHYLQIAKDGYQPLLYFFFPLYPKLISFFTSFGGSSLNSYAIDGLLISFACLILAYWGIYKLVKLDFTEIPVKSVFLLLLIFPTSFYFAAIYGESLFLALVVWSFYFARKKQWFISIALGILLTLTRLVGIALIPALLVEGYMEWKNKRTSLRTLIFIPFISIGLLAYIYFVYLRTGDPLNFFNSVTIFGQQRQSAFILFPQVIYRYLFKILPYLSYNYFPVVFSTYLEFFSAVIFFVLAILAFFKIRLSYAVYSFIAYIIPTFSGSFSSMSRYVLILFPLFILLTGYLINLPKKYYFMILIISFILMTITTALYIRGYWIA
jgi:Gpi18-like mannosyltransferase